MTYKEAVSEVSNVLLLEKQDNKILLKLCRLLLRFASGNDVQISSIQIDKYCPASGEAGKREKEKIASLLRHSQ
jgi:hypothetical protein